MDFGIHIYTYTRRIWDDELYSHLVMEAESNQKMTGNTNIEWKKILARKDGYFYGKDLTQVDLSEGYKRWRKMLKNPRNGYRCHLISLKVQEILRRGTSNASSAKTLPRNSQQSDNCKKKIAQYPASTPAICAPSSSLPKTTKNPDPALRNVAAFKAHPQERPKTSQGAKPVQKPPIKILEDLDWDQDVIVACLRNRQSQNTGKSHVPFSKPFQ
eukprot:Sdes_comp17339_c0_seq1m6548